MLMNWPLVLGMPVTVNFNESDYDLFITSYVPGVPAVPSVGGSATSVTASAVPNMYDFSSTPVTFTIGWRGDTYTVSLITNYVTMPGLVNTMSSQLTGSGLVA